MLSEDVESLEHDAVVEGKANPGSTLPISRVHTLELLHLFHRPLQGPTVGALDTMFDEVPEADHLPPVLAITCTRQRRLAAAGLLKERGGRQRAQKGQRRDDRYGER